MLTGVEEDKVSIEEGLIDLRELLGEAGTVVVKVLVLEAVDVELAVEEVDLVVEDEEHETDAIGTEAEKVVGREGRQETAVERGGDDGREAVLEEGAREVEEALEQLVTLCSVCDQRCELEQVLLLDDTQQGKTIRGLFDALCADGVRQRRDILCRRQGGHWCACGRRLD